MSRETERLTITNAFEAVWPTVQWPVKMENQPLKEPDNGQFAHFIIVQGESQRLTLGKDHMVRHSSYLQIDCYVKLDAGTKQFNAVEDILRDAFDSREFETTDNEFIHFRTLRARNFGPYFQKYRRTFIMEYYRDSHVERT